MALRGRKIDNFDNISPAVWSGGFVCSSILYFRQFQNVLSFSNDITTNNYAKRALNHWKDELDSVIKRNMIAITAWKGVN